MNRKYLEYIARIKGLTTYHYKVLLALCYEPRSQVEVAAVIGLNKQNTFRVFKVLIDKKLIEMTRQEGRTKIYRAITSLERLSSIEDVAPIDGQIELEL